MLVVYCSPDLIVRYGREAPWEEVEHIARNRIVKSHNGAEKYVRDRRGRERTQRALVDAFPEEVAYNHRQVMCNVLYRRIAEMAWING